MLPVPASVRKMEEIEEEKRRAKEAETRRELKDRGVDLNLIPEDELSRGGGETLQAFQTWIRTLDRSDEERTKELLKLKDSIETWREETAIASNVAPVSVMTESLLLQICFSASRKPLTSLDLRDMGLRGSTVPGLVDVIMRWQRRAEAEKSEQQWLNLVAKTRDATGEDAANALNSLRDTIKGMTRSSDDTIVHKICYVASRSIMTPRDLMALGLHDEEAANVAGFMSSWHDNNSGIVPKSAHVSSDDIMVFAEDFVPTKWPHAEYKPNKKTGKAIWEDRLQMWRDGSSITSVGAQNEPKAILASTVAGNLLTALELGNHVDLNRLAGECVSPLSWKDWANLSEAEVKTGIDVREKPIGGMLQRLVGAIEKMEWIENVDYKTMTAEQKVEYNAWREKVNWYCALKRTGYENQHKSD